jgi:RNA recognition motif-containing protein
LKEIRGVFSPYGSITELKMPKNKEGKFTGFVFVTYEIEEEAMRAFCELDNKVIFGRILHVRPAYENVRKKEIEERL